MPVPNNRLLAMAALEARLQQPIPPNERIEVLIELLNLYRELELYP